jgi:NitT/TauT family transport system substrate-binding protein
MHQRRRGRRRDSVVLGWEWALRRPRSAFWCVAALAGSTALLLAGCSAGPSTSATRAPGLEKTKLTVAVLPLVDDAPLYAGLAAGVFTDLGLDVRPMVVKTGAEAVKLVADRKVDVAVSSNTTIIMAAAEGTPLRIVAEAALATRRSVDVLVRPDSGIESVRDLPGKRFAVGNLTCTCLLAVRARIRNLGVDPAKVTFVPVPQKEMPEALRTKKVDAVVTYEPWVTVAQTSFGARELFDPVSGPTSGLPLHSYIVNTAFARANPVTTAALQRGLIASQRLAADRRKVEAVIPQLTGVSPKIASVISLPDFPTSVSVIRLQRIVDLLTSQHLLTTPVDVSDLVILPPEES